MVQLVLPPGEPMIHPRHHPHERRVGHLGSWEGGGDPRRFADFGAGVGTSGVARGAGIRARAGPRRGFTGLELGLGGSVDSRGYGPCRTDRVLRPECEVDPDAVGAVLREERVLVQELAGVLHDAERAVREPDHIDRRVAVPSQPKPPGGPEADRCDGRSTRRF